MEQQVITNALERIDNPILLLLLAVLVFAIVFLWKHYVKREQMLTEVAISAVGGLKDINAAIGGFKETENQQTHYLVERIERIEVACEQILSKLEILKK